MNNTLFPVPTEQPVVLLASGPGPAPSIDPDDAGQLVLANLMQVDHETGLRGWSLMVHHGRPSMWPRHHFSRGVRPPMIAARETALRTLGYEPASEERWRWQEFTTLDGKHVLMAATITVRPLQQDQAVAL